MADALTDPDTDHSKDVELKQTQDGWQSTVDDIGGIDVTSLAVGSGKTVTVAYDADATDNQVSIAIK